MNKIKHTQTQKESLQYFFLSFATAFTHLKAYRLNPSTMPRKPHMPSLLRQTAASQGSSGAIYVSRRLGGLPEVLFRTATTQQCLQSQLTETAASITSSSSGARMVIERLQVQVQAEAAGELSSQ